MPIIQHVLKIELDLSKPAHEICAVISAVSQTRPDKEEEILQAVKTAIVKRIDELQEVKQDAGRNEKN